MKRYAYIGKLEESMEVVDKLPFEDSLRILEKKKISEGMSKTFQDVESVKEEEINSITDNRAVKALLYLYCRMNNIIIEREESVSISDLSEGLIEYGKSVSKCKKYTKEEIEDLFRTKKDVDKILIINSYLNYVYLEALRYSVDEEMFEDLLSVGNVTLLDAVENYDETKHISFELYLSYMMNEAISKRTYDIAKAKQLTVYKEIETVFESPEERIIERMENRQIVNELLETSCLTSRERQIIDLKYGFVDGCPYDSKYIAQVLHMDPITEISLEASAMTKIKKRSIKKAR